MKAAQEEALTRAVLCGGWKPPPTIHVEVVSAGSSREAALQEEER